MKFLKHVNNTDKLILILASLIIFTAGVQVGQNFSLVDSSNLATLNDPNLDRSFNLSPLENVWGVINNDYVDLKFIDKDKVSFGLAKGVVESLGDPYSIYFNPDETEIFSRELDQELEGIGAEVTQEEGVLKIVSPLKGSPAEKAGLKPNDIILAIDEEDARDFNLYEAIEKIRGKQGTTVNLSIARAGETSALEIRITRDVIELESITTEILDSNIMHISINQFSDDTTKEFESIVRETLLANPKGIVLDLRYNGGGYLQTAVDILGEFLPKGSDAVIVESSADKNREILKTNGTTRLEGIPLVVLINEGSASASEILAGALQDNDKAFLIGKTSFGKGSVQKIEQFRDGSSLKLTIAKWFTPNGNDIDKKGIVPNLEIEQSETDTEKEIDTQLQRSISYLKSLR
jgi:carboxyl-terminal processing protease